MLSVILAVGILEHDPISPNPDCDDTLDWLWPAAERA